MVFDYCSAGENSKLRDAMVRGTQQLRTLMQQTEGDPLKKIQGLGTMISNLINEFRHEGVCGNEFDHISFVIVTEWLHCVTKIIHDLHNAIENKYQRRIEMKGQRYWSENTLDDVMIQMRLVRGQFNTLLPKKFISSYLKIGEHFTQPLLRQMSRTLITSIKTLAHSLLKIAKRDNFIDYLTNTSLIEIVNICPASYCSICKDKKLQDVQTLIILDSCKHLFCATCFNRPHQPYKSCPTCNAKTYDHTTSLHFWEHFGEYQLANSVLEVDIPSEPTASLAAIKYAVEVRQRAVIDLMRQPDDC